MKLWWIWNRLTEQHAHPILLGLAVFLRGHWDRFALLHWSHLPYYGSGQLGQTLLRLFLVPPALITDNGLASNGHCTGEAQRLIAINLIRWN